MLPRIISAVGEAITAEDIAAVQRACGTRKDAGLGVYRVTDILSGILVEYHAFKNIAFVTSGGTPSNILTGMPNPIPARAVHAGFTDGSVPGVRIVDGGPGVAPGALWETTVDGVSVAGQTGSFVGITIGGANYIQYTNFLANAIGIFSGHIANGITGGGGVGPITPSISYFPDTSGTLVLTHWTLTAVGQGAIAAAEGKRSYLNSVITSDKEVLASDVQTSTHTAGNVTPDSVSFAANTQWSGGSSIYMYRLSKDPFTLGASFDRKLTFTVPEDCILPTPQATAPTNTSAMKYPTSTTQSERGGTIVSITADITAGVEWGQWQADWQQGAVEFAARKKAWLKKNSDEFIAAMKYGFQVTYTDVNGAEQSVPGVTREELKTGKLPSDWRSAIKKSADVYYDGGPLPAYPKDENNAYASEYTKRAAIINAVFTDVETDATNGGFNGGVWSISRTVSLKYTFENELFATTIIGTKIGTVIEHKDRDGVRVSSSIRWVYSNWLPRMTSPYDADDIPQEEIGYVEYDRHRSIGVVVNGVVQSGYTPDTTDSGINVPDFAHLTPPIPASSNNTVGTVPAFFSLWHATGIEYLEDAIGFDLEQNDYATYGITSIELTPVGVPGVGIFGDAFSADVGNATEFELYGTAVYDYNWATGELTFNRWEPKTGIFPLPDGVSLITDSEELLNCLISYKTPPWANIKTAIKTRNAYMKTEGFWVDSGNAEMWALKTIIDAAKA